ncbi:MFS transporter MCT family solute carrier family 16 (monocarboxylic acid transporters) member 10 [Microdochium nivale]|nr:MFS transporter MCT family solute carrier family 16 (monocarboxylic acid transporters) member 10 [Microdochium nivale]
MGSTPTLIQVASPSGPPNSGTRAWLQVMGSFMLYMNTWGLLSSYGTIQTYYETELLQSDTSFRISIIGALQSFLLVFLGFLAGPIYDAGFFRYLLIAGSVLIFVGTLAQSFCTQLWHLIIAEGLCVGLGCGCLGVLSVAIPASWFTSKLPLANGIAASGSGFGGVIYPILIRQLLPTVGFAWAIRTIALFIAVSLGLANLILRDPQSATLHTTRSEQKTQNRQLRPRRRLIDKASLTDWPYVLFVAACFLVFLGMYTPFFNVQTFAIQEVGMSTDKAFYIVMAMNIASIPGRLVPALVAAKLGPINLIIVATFSLAGAGLGMLGLRSGSGDVAVYAVAVIYGFLTGSFFGLQPTVFVRVTSDLRVLGTRFGMAFTVLSVALLFGTPISGQLVDQFGYDAAWIYVGITIILGGTCVLLARFIKEQSRLGRLD